MSENVIWLDDRRYGNRYRLKLDNGIEYIRSSRGTRPRKERKIRKTLSSEDKLLRSQYMKMYRLKQKEKVDELKNQLYDTTITQQEHDENSNLTPN